MSFNQPYLTFHDGQTAPQLGLGTWKTTGDAVLPAIKAAVSSGYRAIDTAYIYYNEAEIGQAISQCGVPREDLFITTKVWNNRHGHDSTKAAFQESLDKLQLDYIDLFLIHWPVPKEANYIDTWKALIELRDEGGAKSIGVCNFEERHLQKLLDNTGVIPVVNQVELHPYFQQQELRDYHSAQGIITEAWSPLGQGQALTDPVILSIAQKHKVSAAQVIIKWHIQLGNMVIPKSTHTERIKQNFQVWQFRLDDDDMARIATLDKGERIGPDPERFHDMKG